MNTHLTFQPGQRGTKKLLEEDGDRLVYVRDRSDPTRTRRGKTVEVISDEVPWASVVGRISRETGY